MMSSMAERCGIVQKTATPTGLPFAMELREAALRMTHLYWYWSGCPFTDQSSSKRLASLLYVDTN